MTGEAISCGYQGHEFGASYPDSICIDGHLWDADSGDGARGLTSGGEMACPRCNTAARLEQLREAVQDVFDPDTPQMAVWEHQLRQVIGINEAAALAALAAMPRHVFWRYRLDGAGPRPEIAPEASLTWPWPVPHLSAHQNLRIMSAKANPAGIDPEAPQG